MVREGVLAIAALLAMPMTATAAPWQPPITLLDNGSVDGLTALPAGGFLGSADAGGNLKLTTFGVGATTSSAVTYPGGPAPVAQATAGDGSTVIGHAGFDSTQPAGQGASLAIVVRDPQGAVSAPDTIRGDRPIQHVAAAGSADGALAVAWTDGETAFLRIRAPGTTTFGAPEQLTGNIGNVALGYTPAGHLLVAERRDDGLPTGRVILEDRAPDSSPPDATQLGALPPETSQASDHQIAVASGEAGTAVAWDAAGPVPDARYEDLMWRLLPAGATSFEPPESLERTALFDPVSLSLVVTPGEDGRAVALAAVAPRGASAPVKTTNPPRKAEIYSSGRALGSGNSGQRLSPEQGARYVVRDVANTRLAVGHDGDLLATWTTTCPVCDTKVMAATAISGSSFGSATAVNGLGFYASDLRAAVDRAGRGAIAWTQARRLPGPGARPALASVANAVADGAGRVDANPPLVRMKPQTTAAEAVAQRRVSVSVRCSERCFVHLSLRRASAVHGANAVLEARTPGVLTLKVPRGVDGLGALKQGIRKHRRQLLVTVGDGQGNLTQVLRAL